jgi:hypothetical protein
MDRNIVFVYLNREKVINKISLRKFPIERTIKLSQLIKINELVVYTQFMENFPQHLHDDCG